MFDEEPSRLIVRADVFDHLLVIGAARRSQKEFSESEGERSEAEPSPIIPVEESTAISIEAFAFRDSVS